MDSIYIVVISNCIKYIHNIIWVSVYRDGLGMKMEIKNNIEFLNERNERK